MLFKSYIESFLKHTIEQFLLFFRPFYLFDIGARIFYNRLFNAGDFNHFNRIKVKLQPHLKH